MKNRGVIFIALCCALGYVQVPGYAAEPESVSPSAQAVADPASSGRQALPEPLTLEYALTLLDETHPRLQQIQADIRSADAERLFAETQNEFSLSAKAALQYVEPPSAAPNQENNDSYAALVAQKTLYDFGRTDSLSQAAESDFRGAEFEYAQVKREQRLEIMRRYFDVVLADLQFYRYNEEMATEYVQLDRLRARRELGRASDFDVLQKEVSYNKVRHLRADSQNMQRVTRARLAFALNRPDDLPDTVAKPRFSYLTNKLPEVEKLQEIAMMRNTQVQSLRNRLAAARAKVDYAYAGDNPRLKSELGVYEYNRKFGSRDDVQAAIILEIPLAGGSQVNAKVAKARADVYKADATLQLAERNVKQAILEQWLKLDGLRTKLDEVQVNSDYRELYLDRSRTLYELEVKADLGDAMVRISEAEYFKLATEFDTAIGWEKLAALTGISLDELLDLSKQEATKPEEPTL